MSWPERIHTLPDGCQVRAVYEGELVGYVVHFVGREERAVAAGDVRDALIDLLDERGDRPFWLVDGTSWLRAAADDLAARDTPLGRRYPCPCCGFLTLDRPPSGTYSLCEVCFWEDDERQFRNPDYEGGANGVSLNQARENFGKHGACEWRARKSVRAPLPEEQP
jgi:hypothetical protein